MKAYFFSFFAFFFLVGCKKTHDTYQKDYVGTPNIHYSETPAGIDLNSGKFQYHISRSALPYKKVILLNASLAGFFLELEAEEGIIGVSSPEYIYSEKIRQRINSNNIKNVGSEQKYDVEQIISLKPDAIFTNYIASFENTYDLLRKNGIQIIFIDEFMEQDPLEKASLINVFGKLLGREKISEERYASIAKTYDSLKIIAKKDTKRPLVLANEIYGSQWFLPGGKTSLARLVADANANYINAGNPEGKAVPMSFEEVYVRAENAEYWINAGDHTAKKELLAINPNYAKMKVFNTGKLYSITAKVNGRANDFFESGSVRADLVLKDYIKIFHPNLLPDYQLTYQKELK